jgi:RNA polymerase sigma-70 factor (ECF subfamily)
MRYRIDHSPVDQYEFREHINYCFTCLAKTLQLEHQLALILKEIYQFKVSEIMDILNLSEGRVKHALAQARRLMNDIFDRRCVLINKQGVCHQCSEMSGFVNPKQDAQQRALELKLVQEANLGTSREHLFDLRAELIRNLDPLQAPATSVHEYLLELMDQTVGSGF